MRKFIISISLFIISISTILSQQSTDPKVIINNFLNEVNSSAISGEFSLLYIEKNGVNSQAVNGKFLLKGQQFFFDMNEIKVWFDGKTQWAYMEDSHEVTITEPGREELAETNPVVIISQLVNASKLTLKSKSGDAFHTIEMVPRQSNQGISKIEVRFSKGENALQSIELMNQNGTRSTLRLTNYRQRVATHVGSFRFDSSKFSGVVMNDLR